MASSRVAWRRWWTGSVSSVWKKPSVGASSDAFPRRLMDGRLDAGFGQGGRSGGGRQPAPQAAPQSDPWSQSSGGNYDWGSGQDDEPPF